LRAIAPKSAVLPECGALLLGERARLMGLVRGGRVSPNGSCRLIETRDGRIALNLARSDDWDLMPILLGVEQAGDWIDVERAAARKTTAELVETGIEFGLPVARDELVAPPVSPFAIEDGDASGSAPARPPRVLDFASLWAGPLAASLLGMLGADVVKVESVHRLDGARHGDGGFFDLLNSGKRSVAIDFADPDQHRRLLALVDSADIVIEGSRPRALRRLGILREDFVARGGIWTAITAHDDPDRVGFGDDAAVAAGVAAHMARVWGAPMFAGDAIADPLTGLHAALATWQMWRQRRSGLVRPLPAVKMRRRRRRSIAGRRWRTKTARRFIRCEWPRARRGRRGRTTICYAKTGASSLDRVDQADRKGFLRPDAAPGQHDFRRTLPPDTARDADGPARPGDEAVIELG
jgi:hypothetical protein